MPFLPATQQRQSTEGNQSLLGCVLSTANLLKQAAKRPATRQQQQRKQRRMLRQLQCLPTAGYLHFALGARITALPAAAASGSVTDGGGGPATGFATTATATSLHRNTTLT